jgi:uncharacterized membrane protein YuzA (DUF378 family)
MMKKSFRNIAVLNSIFTAVVMGVGSVLLGAFRLDFVGVFRDYLAEALVLIGLAAVMTGIIACDVFAFRSEKAREQEKAIKDERDSCNKRFEELQDVELESKQLRAIIKYKRSKRYKGQNPG